MHAVNHLVANAGVWSSCFFEEITNVSAFQNVMVSKHKQHKSTVNFLISHYLVNKFILLPSNPVL